MHSDAGAHHAVDLCGEGAHPGEGAGQELVQHDTEHPPVRLQAEGLPPDHLGAEVVVRLTEVPPTHCRGLMKCGGSPSRRKRSESENSEWSLKGPYSMNKEVCCLEMVGCLTLPSPSRIETRRWETGSESGGGGKRGGLSISC